MAAQFKMAICAYLAVLLRRGQFRPEQCGKLRGASGGRSMLGSRPSMARAAEVDFVVF